MRMMVLAEATEAVPSALTPSPLYVKLLAKHSILVPKISKAWQGTMGELLITW